MDTGLIVYGDVIWGAELSGTYSWDNPEDALGESSQRISVATLSASSSYWWAFDLGVSTELDALGIINHNMHTLGMDEIRVRTSADGVAWGVPVITETPAAYMEPNMCMTFTPTSARFWRIDLMNISGTGTFQVGAVMLGTALELDQAPAAPYIVRSGDLAHTKETRGGGVFASAGGGIVRRVGLRWTLAPASMAAELVDVYRVQEGSRHPICFVDHASDGSDPYACRYMSMEDLRVGQVGKGDRWAIQLELEDA